MTQIADIQTLGFGAPFLGRWFEGVDTTNAFQPLLRKPRDDLGVPLPDMSDQPDTAQLRWLAPGFGHVGYALSGPDTALEVLKLEAADGSRLFARPGMFIASFRLHDGARARLQSLWDALPPLTQEATSNDRPLPAIFTIALETSALGDIGAMAEPPLNADRVSDAMGLSPVGDAPRPRLVRDFKAPAVLDPELAGLGGPFPLDASSAATLLSIPKALAAFGRLYVHDVDGLPMDPGMAASGLHALVELHPDLLPKAVNGLPTPLPAPASMICDVDQGLFIHLCHPAGGPLNAQALTRISVEMVDGSPVADTVLRDLPGADATLRLAPGGRSDAQTSEPMIAGVLPNGALLPEPGVARIGTALRRDQLRIGVVAHEQLLTGLGVDEERQEFASARIAVARGEAQIGVTGAGFGQVLVDVLAAGAGAVASEQIDADFGAPQEGGPSALLPAELVPDDLRDALSLTLHHLRGTGRLDGDFVRGQSVLATLRLDVTLLEASVPPPAPGTQAHVFLHALDPKTGRLVYLPSGAGRWRDVAGVLTLDIVLADLPQVTTDAEAPVLALDVLMPAPGRDRLLRDLRGARPDFVAAAPVIDLASASDLLICEAGLTGTALTKTPGQTLISGAGSSAPTLVNPDSATGFAEGTLARTLTANHKVTRLPAPGMSAPRHDLTALTGAASQEITPLTDPGGGLLGRHRGTVAAAGNDAVIATAPAAAQLLGSANLAHPFDTVRGAPALQTFVAVKGPAARAVAEALRGIDTPDVEELVTSTPQPGAQADPEEAVAQIAVLRSCGAGGEGSRLGVAFASLDSAATMREIDDLMNDLKSSAPSEVQALMSVLEIAIAGQAHRARALHRRILAAQGSTEMYTALRKAFETAQRDIIIAAETFDDIAGASADLQGVLRDRLVANPTLRLIVLVPDRVAARKVFDPDETGDDGAKQWMAPLQASAPDRATILRSAGPLRSRLRGFGTFVAVDGMVSYHFAGGLSSWGLERNSSIGVAVLGEAFQNGRARLVDQATREVLSWFLGVEDTVLPRDWRDLKSKE